MKAPARDGGAALLVSIVFTAVMFTIAMSVVELSAASRRGAIAAASRVQAAAIAEAGLDEALRTIAAGSPAGASKAFGGGAYVVTVQGRSDGSHVFDIRSVGRSGLEDAVIDAAALASSTTTLVSVSGGAPAAGTVDASAGTTATGSSSPTLLDVSAAGTGVTVLGSTRAVLVLTWVRRR